MGVGENLNGSWGKFEWENGHFSRLFSRNIFRCFLEGKFFALDGQICPGLQEKEKHTELGIVPPANINASKMTQAHAVVFYFTCNGHHPGESGRTRCRGGGIHPDDPMAERSRIADISSECGHHEFFPGKNRTKKSRAIDQIKPTICRKSQDLGNGIVKNCGK